MTTTPDTPHVFAIETTNPIQVDPELSYAVPDGDGALRLLNTDAHRDHPRHAKAQRVVTDAESFVSYLAKHGLPSSEVWADIPGSTVVAVINTHAGASQPAGWDDHRLTLKLEKSIPWLAWEKFNGQWFDQTDFAEFIQERASDVLEPAAADMLELAQHFSAARNVDFKSSQRISDGATALNFVETVTAKAGQTGHIAIPDKIRLALRPYVGGPKYAVNALFRYRLNGAQLRLGYVLERPQEILDLAFEDIVSEIRDGKPEVIGRPASEGQAGIEARPATPGITQPIFYGKP